LLQVNGRLNRILRRRVDIKVYQYVFNGFLPQSLAQCPSLSKFSTMHAEDLTLLLTRQMPYGKYKGRAIADLPLHYLSWFSREGFPPGEVGRLLELAFELQHNGLMDLLDPLRKR